MKKIIITLIFFLSQLINVTVFADSPESVEGATTVNTKVAKELFDKNLIFIDARSPNKFKKGHIPNAHNFKSFKKSKLLNIAKQGDEILIYCGGIKCKRSSKAVETALRWGWTNIYYYREGFRGWKKAGYPIE